MRKLRIYILPYSIKEVQKDVSEIVECVRLRERVTMDAKRVHGWFDPIFQDILKLGNDTIRKFHIDNVNLQFRADILERFIYDIKMQYSNPMSRLSRIARRVNVVDTSSCKSWENLLKYTLNSCKDEVFFLNHIEDIWEENEMDHGRTWKERRDEHGRILHLQDKASWMRSSKSRQSRLRFTKRYELNISAGKELSMSQHGGI